MVSGFWRRTLVCVDHEAARRLFVNDPDSWPFFVFGDRDDRRIAEGRESRGSQPLPRLPALVVPDWMGQVIAIRFGLVQGGALKHEDVIH
jgi:hypothetical protein